MLVSLSLIRLLAYVKSAWQLSLFSGISHDNGGVVSRLWIYSAPKNLTKRCRFAGRSCLFAGLSSAFGASFNWWVNLVLWDLNLKVSHLQTVMGIFYYGRAVALAEDLPGMEDERIVNIDEFYTKADRGYDHVSDFAKLLHFSLI